MLSWREMLQEDYNITEEDYNKLSEYEQRIIQKEYDAYIEHFIGKSGFYISD